jgi:hypothetical protein
LLRSRDLGQIDLARVKKSQHVWLLEIAEVKSSEIGEWQMAKTQIGRLYATQKFLSALFGFPSKLIRLIG